MSDQSLSDANRNILRRFRMGQNTAVIAEAMRIKECEVYSRLHVAMAQEPGKHIEHQLSAVMRRDVARPSVGR